MLEKIGVKYSKEIIMLIITEMAAKKEKAPRECKFLVFSRNSWITIITAKITITTTNIRM